MVGQPFKKSILKYFFIDESCWSSAPIVLCTEQRETIHQETPKLAKLLDWDVNVYSINFSCSHKEGLGDLWQKLTMNFMSTVSQPCFKCAGMGRIPE